jgi:hypothetical protein
MAKYLVKWDEGTSTSIEEKHLMLIAASQESSSASPADEETSGLSDYLTRDGESTDDERDEEDWDELPPGHDPNAVITPVGGQVQCGEYRWRRVKAITSDTRAAHPEFDFSLRQTTITETTSLNDILWMCMPVSRGELLDIVRTRAGGQDPRTPTQPTSP